MTNLVIGIPTMGNVPWQFAASLMGLGVPEETRVIWQVRAMINTSRNKMAKQALENKCTHVLMIDDDMVFENDFAFRLLKGFEENPEASIIGGLAFKRRPNFDPCVYKEKDGKIHSILPSVFQEVDAIGTGGMMIKADVFEKIAYPWFETYYENGEVVSVDIDFCRKAKKAGLKMFCDPEALMQHIGDPIVVGKDEFLTQVQYLNNLQKQNDITIQSNNK